MLEFASYSVVTANLPAISWGRGTHSGGCAHGLRWGGSFQVHTAHTYEESINCNSFFILKTLKWIKTLNRVTKLFKYKTETRKSNTEEYL